MSRPKSNGEKKEPMITLLPRKKKNLKPIKIKPTYRWERWFSAKRIVFLFRGRDFTGSVAVMRNRLAVEAINRGKRIATGVDGDVIGLLVLGDR